MVFKKSLCIVHEKQMSALNGFCYHGSAVYSNVLTEIRDTLDSTDAEKILPAFERFFCS